MVVGDTDLTADAGKTSASRQTFVSGNAARLAAEDLRRKILALANAGPDAKLTLDGAAPDDRRRRGLAHDRSRDAAAVIPEFRVSEISGTQGAHRDTPWVPALRACALRPG